MLVLCFGKCDNKKCDNWTVEFSVKHGLSTQVHLVRLEADPKAVGKRPGRFSSALLLDYLGRTRTR